jgi:hypothetical protein
VPATALPRELPSVAQLDRDPLRNTAPNCGAAEPPAPPVPDALACADEVSQWPPIYSRGRAAGIGLAVELAAICTPPRAGNGPRWASTALSGVMPHHPTHPPLRDAATILTHGGASSAARTTASTFGERARQTRRQRVAEQAEGALPNRTVPADHPGAGRGDACIVAVPHKPATAVQMQRTPRKHCA